ncbi:MAG: aminopeptidase [Chloroflexi bacterium]|nr:aminopeptidase [Chloroflexota bacterium]MQC26386.1 aminopeptidase [Chloroflexota bacterium]
MTDPRMDKLAETLVNYSNKVKKGDWCIILGNVIAEPLVDEVVKHVLRAGGIPSVMFNSDRVGETMYREANEEQLKHITPYERHIFEDADVLVSLYSNQNTRSLSQIDPTKQQVRGAARKDLMKTYRDRSASKDLRWVIGLYPCDSLAQEADMSLKDYEDFVYHATFSDKPDPVKEWQKIYDDHERLIKWLNGKKTIELRSPNIDITMNVEGRTFINSAGENNMPSGEIFTSPVEDSTNGWASYTYPAVQGGREVEGIRLEFKDGKVVNATAEKNEEFLLKMLDMDEGARILGELGIGTNFGIDRFTKNILFDEKIGGSIHMAVGAGFPEAGGSNESSLHWDMICDMRTDSEIRVDGDLFYKDGKFQV